MATWQPEQERFKFGNGGKLPSDRRWRLPASVGGAQVFFHTSVVDSPTLGLLLGKDFLTAVGANLNFGESTFDAGWPLQT